MHKKRFELLTRRASTDRSTKLSYKCINWCDGKLILTQVWSLPVHRVVWSSGEELNFRLSVISRLRYRCATRGLFVFGGRGRTRTPIAQDHYTNRFSRPGRYQISFYSSINSFATFGATGLRQRQGQRPLPLALRSLCLVVWRKRRDLNPRTGG